MDKDCSKEMTRSLKKLGIKFHLSHEVKEVDVMKTGVKVHVAKRDSEERFELKADYCLVAIGRRPYTDDLGLENAGVEKDEKGRIKVNDALETNVEGIYAIGDVIRGPMLAHKAEDDGMYVVETIAGQKPHIDYNLVPLVVYTWPEVAAVGKTEDQLKEDGTPYKTGKFPVRALGRARASGDLEGMIKVVAHDETDEVLGVHMVCARAADMIMEAVALMEFKAAAEDIARICHPHPTYTEAIREAAFGATDDRALHM
jgi:dihydrolipoamide dehydrogenase